MTTSQPPVLLILFGLPGVGKNYVGRILAEDYGFYFRDADDDLPDDMRETIIRHEIATDDMRDRHLANIMARIRLLQPDNPRLVVGGAFFKERNRLSLLVEFPQAQFVLLETKPDLLRTRLEMRQNHLADWSYAEKIFTVFERPHHPYVVLHNNAGREQVKTQLEAILQLSPSA